MQQFAQSEQLPARLGESLRRRREEQGLTLRAAAERAGVSPAHLSEVERGVKEPSLTRLSAIGRALDAPPGEVFLDMAIALGAAPPRPSRHPVGFAPDPRDEIAWAVSRLGDEELRLLAAFGAFLVSRSDHPKENAR